jgi:predicted nucleic acid-binding protein
MSSCRPLVEIPSASDAYIDANIFVYGLAGRSAHCLHFLERCSRDEITGITLFETVNEASHRFILAEAKSKDLVQNESARELRKPGLISALSDYWLQTERILAMNLLLLPVD